MMRVKTTKLIKKLLIDAEIRGTELAQRIGTSPQNLFKKINNGTITVADLLQICELLNKEIIFVDKIK